MIYKCTKETTLNKYCQLAKKYGCKLVFRNRKWWELMFNTKNLSKLDANYFNIITVDDRNVTIQSKNTGHYWYLHCTEYPTEDACVIFHKHQHEHPYHQHGRSYTLRQALKSIKDHDAFQLNVRGKV